MRDVFPRQLFMSVDGVGKGEENIRYYKRAIGKLKTFK